MFLPIPNSSMSIVVISLTSAVSVAATPVLVVAMRSVTLLMVGWLVPHRETRRQDTYNMHRNCCHDDGIKSRLCVFQVVRPSVRSGLHSCPISIEFYYWRNALQLNEAKEGGKGSGGLCFLGDGDQPADFQNAGNSL